MPDIHCGTPLKHDLQRDWKKLEAATQKILAKQVAAPVLSGELTQLSPSGRFRIHYTTSGTDASTLAWVQTVAQTFDDVAVFYINLGWNLAPTTNSAPFDIYLRELSSLRLFGQATSTQSLASAGFANAFGSYIEIDNNFMEAIYQNTISGSLSSAQKAQQCLQITAAHEYHHAIQYGYNYFFDVWYAEATSTWHEDELYDNVNQLYNYMPPWFTNSTLALDTPASTTTGGGYGRWIFNRYLAEQHGVGTVRAAWEKLATINSPDGGSDISMIPVLESLLNSPVYTSSLGAEFFGFAKRVYRRDWTSHTADISRIRAYTPTATFSSYPAGTTSTLAHYSFAYYKFTPSASVANLSIALNNTSGIRTALFKNLNGTISEIAANSDGSYYVAGFGSLNSANEEVVLLVVNTTNIDNHQAGFSASSTAVPDYTLSISIPAATTSIGTGQITSDTGGISCSSGNVGTCSALYPADTPVILSAATAVDSTFTGWSGDCTGLTPCNLIMTADKNISVQFDRGVNSQGPAAKIDVTGFNSVNDAYVAAGSHATIMAVAGQQTIGILKMDQGKNILLKGGYTPFFSSATALSTVLQGTLFIDSGSLRASGVKLVPSLFSGAPSSSGNTGVGF